MVALQDRPDISLRSQVLFVGLMALLSASLYSYAYVNREVYWPGLVLSLFYVVVMVMLVAGALGGRLARGKVGGIDSAGILPAGGESAGPSPSGGRDATRRRLAVKGPWGGILLVGTILVFSTLFWYRFHQAEQQYYTSVFPVLMLAVIAVAVASISSPVVRAWAPWMFLAAVIVHSAVVMAKVPVAPGMGGDELQVIQKGFERMLQGHSPYVDTRQGKGGTTLTLPSPAKGEGERGQGNADVGYAAVPMPYLPATVLAYFSLAVVVGMWTLAARRQRRRGSLAVCTLAAAFLWSPFVLRKIITIQTPVYWAVLAVLAYLLIRRRCLLVGVVTGVLIMTRETSIVLVPFIAMALYAHHGLRKTLLASAIGAGVAALLAGPFLAADPQAMVSSIAYNLRDAAGPERKLIQIQHVGLGAWFYFYDATSFARLLQGLIMGVLYTLAWQRRRSPRSMLLLMGAALFLFIWANTMHHEYYYIPGVLLAGFGLICREDRSSEFEVRSSERRREVAVHDS